MRKAAWMVLLLALATASCADQPRGSGTKDSTQTERTQQESESEAEAETERKAYVEQLRKDIEEVANRAEKDLTDVQVQHLLIAHGNAGIPGVSRSVEEAEQLTAEIWQQIKDGADFDALIKEHTNDSPPGIYGMTTSGPGDRNKLIFPRRGMVAAFGDVGWRLEVGEYGVAPFDQTTSPYGWHIIKRLK